MREIELYKERKQKKKGSSEVIHRSVIAMLASIKWEHNFSTIQKAIPHDCNRLSGFTDNKY